MISVDHFIEGEVFLLLWPNIWVCFLPFLLYSKVEVYFTGSLCTSIIAFKRCLFSDCTSMVPQLPSVVSVTFAVKDSCGLPPLMLMFCAKALGHICMFSQSALQLHRIDSSTKAFLWLTSRSGIRRKNILCGVRNSQLCVWESSWCIFALLQVSPVQAADEHDNHRKGQETISFHNILFIFITSCVSSVSHLAFWFCAQVYLAVQTLLVICLSQWGWLPVCPVGSCEKQCLYKDWNIPRKCEDNQAWTLQEVIHELQSKGVPKQGPVMKFIIRTQNVCCG